MILPNFLVIGAYKSGTTSLYHYLRQHPDIFMSRIKEPNFFAHEKKKELMQLEGKTPRVVDRLEAYAALFAGAGDKKAIGEASPIYMHYPQAAKRIKATLPDVKLIAILRHPVEAFYSDHHMRIRDRRQLSGDIEERFKTEVEAKMSCGQVNGLMYFEQLSTYFDLFGSQRIRVYLFEDLIQDSRALIQDIYGFLGVDDRFAPTTSKRHNVGGIPKSHLLNGLLKRTSRIGGVQRMPFLSHMLSAIQKANMSPVQPLPREAKYRLTRVLREDIIKLEQLINRDLAHWLADPTPA